MIEGSTERLELRPLTLDDAPAIQREFPHWPIVRYLLKRVPWPYPSDGAATFCRDVALPQMERNEAWYWTLRLKSEPEAVIGMLNLVPGETNNRGLWLGQSWQGQGLMSEACAWANDYWFFRLAFPVLRVSKATVNVASRRLSIKQGMRVVGITQQDYIAGRLPTEIWELTSAEWRAWKAHSGPVQI